MSLEAAKEPVTVTDSRPVFQFNSTGTKSWTRWDRFIVLNDEPAFHIGNICNTCDFFFKRLAVPPQSIDTPADIAALLNSGLKTLEDSPCRQIAAVLPRGRYQPVLSSGVPRHVRPGDDNDYFVREQVALWNGVESSVHEPYDPGTDYYRLGTHDIGEGRALYEFVVPTFPTSLLRNETVQEYRRRETVGSALAVSVLDIKTPAFFGDVPAVSEHWCLTHYLLDGNHKTYAASLEARPLSVLSFLALDHGVSTNIGVSKALGHLSAAP